MSERQLDEGASDPVRCPRHYAGANGIEAKEAMRNMADRPLGDAVIPMTPMAVFWWCTAFKYLWRFPFKNGRQDVLKCQECLSNLERELWFHDSQGGGDNRGME